jgi:hypothetical protein
MPSSSQYAGITRLSRTAPGAGPRSRGVPWSDRTAANIVGYWCDRLLGQRPEPTYGIAVDFLRQEAAANTPLDLTTDNIDNGQPQHTGVWHLNPANTLSQHYTIARLRVAIGLILCSPDFLRR